MSFGKLPPICVTLPVLQSIRKILSACDGEPVNAFVNRAIRAAVPFIVFPFRNLVKCSFAVEQFHAWVSFVWNNFQHFIRAIRDAVNIPVRSGDAAVKFVVLGSTSSK